jgi:hypothetical protein
MKAFPTKLYHDGPAAHEDLTIAEHLEALRSTEEDRPGAQAFLNIHGETCWFDDSEVADFIARYGAEHPAEYLATRGEDWLTTFFNRNSIQTTT